MKLGSWLTLGTPCLHADDYKVVPTDEPMDVYSPKPWKRDALFQPEPRRLCTAAATGMDRCLHTLHPAQPINPFGKISGSTGAKHGHAYHHLLLSTALTNCLEAAVVDTAFRRQEGASDHAPT